MEMVPKIVNSIIAELKRRCKRRKEIDIMGTRNKLKRAMGEKSGTSNRIAAEMRERRGMETFSHDIFNLLLRFLFGR